MNANPYKWTNEALTAEALQYPTRGAFRKGSPSAYTIAARNGQLRAICGHMTHKRRSWTLEEILALAQTCTSKRELRAKHLPAHEFARRHGWFDQVTAHMVPSGTGESTFVIYQLSFPGGETYIGLSCSLNLRMLKHLKKGTVARHMKATGCAEPEIAILHSGLGSVEASRLEVQVIAEARKTHKALLNRHKGGGLGAYGRRSMTKARILARARRYKTRTEFREKDRASHMMACRMGWMAEACKHMSSQRRNLTTGDLAAIARKYSSRGEFQKHDRSAYMRAWERGVLDGVCAHMPAVRRTHSDEDLANLASKYSTRTEFQKGDPGAYTAAWTRGLLDDICQHMHRAS